MTQLKIIDKILKAIAGNSNWGGRLSTIDLLTKAAGFEKSK
jgi:hypothetical protein